MDAQPYLLNIPRLHRPSSCDQAQKDHPKAVRIAFVSDLAHGNVLGCCREDANKIQTDAPMLPIMK